MSKRILVVDDEPDIVETVKARLRSRGYEVMTALRGRDALDLIERIKPDLIILDIMMPGVDGTELSETLRLRDSTKTIPIIFLTALQTKLEEKAKGPWVAGKIVLAKPFDAIQLLEHIETIFSQHS